MDGKIITLFLGMMLVTYLPRVLPLVVLSKVDIPRLFMRWLKYIPVAVLASLLAPELFLDNGRPDFSFSNLFFWPLYRHFLLPQ